MQPQVLHVMGERTNVIVVIEETATYVRRENKTDLLGFWREGLIFVFSRPDTVAFSKTTQSAFNLVPQI